MTPPSFWRSARPLVIGRSLSAVAGFALPVVLGRVLDASGYGTYKQVYLVVNIALYSLQFGLAQSLFYFVPRASDEDQRRRFIGQAQTMLALIGGVACVALIVGVPLLATKFSNPELMSLGVPMGILGGALIAAAPAEIALTSRGRPDWSATFLVITDVARITAMLLAIRLGGGINGLIWTAAIAAVARWVASLVLCGGMGHFGLTREVTRRELVYSLPFGVAVLLLNQQMQMHQVFVSLRTAPALFALYSVGCMQIPIVSLLYTPVSETLQVRLADLERRGETQHAGQVFSGAVDHLALAFLPLCALLMATARPGLHVLYGGRYDDAAAVMRIAVLSVAVSSIPVDGVLKARAKTGTLLWIYAIKLAVTWPMLMLGYRVAGLEGAIGAHVVVESMTKFGQLAVVSADLHVPMAQLLGGASIVRAVTLAVTCGAISMLLVRLIHQPIWACLGSAAITAAAVSTEIRRRQSVTVSVESTRMAKVA